ncbi:MAG: hypothetical protein LBC90_04665, partial [Candidatus Adiutrix sp.]|nr:hypothetical protein [Candidatus Adiutrix sp.]
DVLTDLSEGRDFVVRPAIRQLSLFDEPEPEAPRPEPPAPEPPALVRRLAALAPETLTPLAALNLLNELNQEAKKLLDETAEGQELEP